MELDDMEDRAPRPVAPGVPGHPGRLAALAPPVRQRAHTLDVIRRLATTLNVTADLLVFDNDERGPDDDLRLAFEATLNLDPDERNTVREVIEALLLNTTPAAGSTPADGHRVRYSVGTATWHLLDA